jgi:uncharacterized glyoxalase superfamily protein PhnB
MAAAPKNTRATIIPALRYRDAAAAIEWLCKAFGFEKQAVYAGDNGVIEHAQLTFGNGMIMLGSARDNEYGRFFRTPQDAGGVTQGAYLVVDDADAHYAQAKAIGAEIVLDIKTQDYGGRDYTCRDPEGHVWTFGTYDPWQQS